MKEHFINELKRLHSLIAAQGQHVAALIEQAITSYASGDAALAQQVIAEDAAIDAEEIRIEEECLKILALHQPVASDLRTVAAIFKINTSLERMADFGAHIAERVERMHRSMAGSDAEKVDFGKMQQMVLSMLHETLEVIRNRDTVSAYGIINDDEAVDTLRHRVLELCLQALRRYPARAEYYVDCIGISRDLERIADIATDICEHVIYLETGKIIRHQGA